jgi:hypothetical protein
MLLEGSLDKVDKSCSPRTSGAGFRAIKPENLLIHNYNQKSYYKDCLTVVRWGTVGQAPFVVLF